MNASTQADFSGSANAPSDRFDALRARLPDAARDMRLNLDAVLGDGTLSHRQRHAVALACAWALHEAALVDALHTRFDPSADAGLIDDARAAAVLMAMNNVLYRTRHMLGKPSYEQAPARLRMNRMLKLGGTKADFELMCLAVSAINGCEVCLRAHEKTVLDHGLTETHVFEAIRIAAVVKGFSVGLAIAS